MSKPSEILRWPGSTGSIASSRLVRRTIGMVRPAHPYPWFADRRLQPSTTLPGRTGAARTCRKIAVGQDGRRPRSSIAVRQRICNRRRKLWSRHPAVTRAAFRTTPSRSRTHPRAPRCPAFPGHAHSAVRGAEPTSSRQHTSIPLLPIGHLLLRIAPTRRHRNNKKKIHDA